MSSHDVVLLPQPGGGVPVVHCPSCEKLNAISTSFECTRCSSTFRVQLVEE